MNRTNVPAPPETHNVCRGCAAEIPVADRFCPYCGTESVVEASATTQPMWAPPNPSGRAAAPVRPVAPPPPPPRPMPQPPAQPPSSPPRGPSRAGAWRWIVVGLVLLLPVAIIVSAISRNDNTTPGGSTQSDAARTRALVVTLANGAGTSSERCSAAADLGAQKTRAAVDGLVASLSDGAVTACVASALGTAGDVRAVRPLVHVLSRKPTGGDAVSRLYWADSVADTLGRLRDPRAVGALLDHMAHPSASEWTTKAMADALVAIAGRGLSRLLPQIKSPDASVRSATFEVLGRIGDRRAEPALLGALANPTIARGASDALATMYTNNVAHLLPLLQSKQTLAVAYGLIGIGKSGTEPALVAALMNLGDETLARFYLNCGNAKLEQAAHDWASAHGYVVVPGFGIGSPSWGKL